MQMFFALKNSPGSSDLHWYRISTYANWYCIRLLFLLKLEDSPVSLRALALLNIYRVITQ
jgi:hypothetical protein